MNEPHVHPLNPLQGITLEEVLTMCLEAPMLDVAIVVFDIAAEREMKQAINEIHPWLRPWRGSSVMVHASMLRIRRTTGLWSQWAGLDLDMVVDAGGLGGVTGNEARLRLISKGGTVRRLVVS